MLHSSNGRNNFSPGLDLKPGRRNKDEDHLRLGAFLPFRTRLLRQAGIGYAIALNRFCGSGDGGAGGLPDFARGAGPWYPPDIAIPQLPQLAALRVCGKCGAGRFLCIRGSRRLTSR